MSVFYWSPRKKWIVQWTENGKRTRRYFATEQEARAFEDDRLTPQEDLRLTLGELVALYFRSNPDKHPMTRQNILYFLTGYEKDGKHIEGPGEFLLYLYAESLNRADLERMREAVRARGSKNVTINKYQAYIRAILAWGVDQQLIHSNPWRDYKRLPVKKFEVTATLADFKVIIGHCPDWLRWALATAYALAMRPGHAELFALTWDAFNWRLGHVQYAQGKSGRLKRVVPPPWYWQEAKERYEQDMAAGIPWVCHKLGKKVKCYRSAWDKAKKAAGFEGRCIRFYDIRHAAASEMLAAGADLAAVAAQLGHSSITTTGMTYAHVTPGSQARAAALMPALSEKE